MAAGEGGGIYRINENRIIKQHCVVSVGIVSNFTDQCALNALNLNMKFKYKWSLQGFWPANDGEGVFYLSLEQL